MIDADGHLLEFLPLVNDIVREVAGDGVADRYSAFMRRGLAPDDAGLRARTRVLGPARGAHARPHDRDAARADLPAPRRARHRLRAALPELAASPCSRRPTTRCARRVARALNTYYAEVYADYRDRLEPVAVIPTFTPRRGDRRARPRGRHARPQGRGHERRRSRRDPSRRQPRRWVDTLGHGSALRLRPALAALRRARRRARRSTASATAGEAACRRPTTCTTTSATSPPRRRRPAARC